MTTAPRRKPGKQKAFDVNEWARCKSLKMALDGLARAPVWEELMRAYRLGLRHGRERKGKR